MGSPRETQNVIPSPTSKGQRKNYRLNVHEVSCPPPPPPPPQCERENGGAQCSGGIRIYVS